MFVSSSGAGNAVTGEGVQSFAQTPLSVEARMWHRNSVHDERVASETLDFESQLLEVIAVCLEGIAFGWP